MLAVVHMANNVERKSRVSRAVDFFVNRLSTPEQKRAKLRKETLDTLINYVVVPTLQHAIDANRPLWQGEAMQMIFEMRSARLMMGIETAEVNNDPRVAPLLKQIEAIKAST